MSLQVAQHSEEAGAGGWVRTISSDMESVSSIDSLAKSVLEEHEGVDILVLNAGTSLGGGDILKGDPCGWESTVNINLIAPMRLTRLLTPHMKEKGKGALVFTGSLAGVRPTKTAAYGASKHAIRSWAEACYEALCPYGIRVSILEPGYVNTPMLKDHPADHSLFIQPQDLAEAALLPFLLEAATPLEIVMRLVKPVE